MEDHTHRDSSHSEKQAGGVVVFLLEELSDARMRCAQLKRLVAEAIKLVEKSEQRDHCFEVAGHLLHDIPDNLLRLEKALDAAAMSGARMDYEEIKENLKPEKAEELEQVLDDARLKVLRRRSGGPMNAKSAAEEIRRIADQSEATGSVPVNDLLVLVAALEKGSKQAAEGTVASRLRSIADDLVGGPNPSRVATAQALRTLLAGALRPTASQMATALMQQANSREEVMKGFKGENPDLTEEQLKNIADQWEKNKNVVKDKQATVGLDRQLDQIRRKFALDTIAPLKGLVSRLDANPPFTMKGGEAVQDFQTAGLVQGAHTAAREVMEMLTNFDAVLPKVAPTERVAAKSEKKIDKAKVQKWMKLHLKEYIDPKTDEANTTKLAEECCQDLDLHEGNDIPEELFEIAQDIAERSGHGVRLATADAAVE